MGRIITLGAGRGSRGSWNLRPRSAVGAGDDKAKGAGSHALESVDVACGVFNGESVGREAFADFLADRGLARDDEDSAHGFENRNPLILDHWLLRGGDGG